jgi:hypothetical protein
MDRNLLGPLGPIAFHGIAETHVSHHIFKNAGGVAKMVGVEEGGEVSDSGVDMGESK